jgi:hypothetical protein
MLLASAGMQRRPGTHQAVVDVVRLNWSPERWGETGGNGQGGGEGSQRGRGVAVAMETETRK